MFGRHDWVGCRCSACAKTRNEGHDWVGCRCSACAKTRNEGHDWNTDCEVCSVCGAVRPTSHNWEGCTCLTCGKTRDEGHDWRNDCEKCSRCSVTRVTRADYHDWEDWKCQNCGKMQYDWAVNRVTASWEKLKILDPWNSVHDVNRIIALEILVSKLRLATATTEISAPLRILRMTCIRKMGADCWNRPLLGREDM